jgi:hypothetical protein
MGANLNKPGCYGDRISWISQMLEQKSVGMKLEGGADMHGPHDSEARQMADIRGHMTVSW